MVILRLGNVERRLSTSDALATAWQQHLPSFVNAVASVRAFGFQLRKLSDAVTQHWAKIGELQERIEFVRAEIMFESRYGGKGANASPPGLSIDKVERRILNPDAVASLTKVNLGCGHRPLAGYVNVDGRELPGVDVVAPLDDLPFEAAALDEICSAHVLEHFPQEQLRRVLLPHWRRLLKVGGTLRATVPDADAMIRELYEGRYSFDDFREVFWGGQEYAGDFHFNMFTPGSLSKLLGDGGFSDIQIIEAARKNGKCFEFEIVARRGGS
jgi:SAM-dependent methyltransferase